MAARWPRTSLRSLPDHPRRPYWEIRPTAVSRPAGAPIHTPGEDRAMADHQAGLRRSTAGARANQGGRPGGPPPAAISLSCRLQWRLRRWTGGTGPAPGQRRPSGRARPESTVSMVSGPLGGGAIRRNARSSSPLMSQAGQSMRRWPKQQQAWLASGESAVSRTTASDESARVIEETLADARPIAPVGARSSSGQDHWCAATGRRVHQLDS